MWGGENPYWQPPEVEEPRTARVRDGVRKHVKDLHNVLFMVIKSWNDNVVLYEYADGLSTVVRTSWLSLEPADLERHLKVGNAGLRSPLNAGEELLFGCSVSVVEGGRYLVRMNQEQLADRIFEMVMDSEGNPAVIGQVSGVMCRIEHAYVHMKKGPLPDADYMHLYGRSLVDGSRVVERIQNSS